jgi:hypothetical protein
MIYLLNFHKGFRQDIGLNYLINGNCIYPSEVLILNGLLSNAPEHPSWAVSIHTLELYHSQRLIKPNYAIQAFLQALCLRVRRRYYSNLSAKFSQAYDLFLAINWNVDQLVQKALGRSDPTFRIKNFCPPCANALKEESTLEYGILYSIDGGNSLKRFKDAGSASKDHIFSSDFLISRDKVDEWKHVIKRTVKTKKRIRKQQSEFCTINSISKVLNIHLAPDDEDSGEDSDDPDVAIELGERTEAVEDDNLVITKNVQGDPTDTSDPYAICVERWKANADDAKKGMFSCFDESGLFVAVCRHGLLITACDMVQSGEL